MVLAAGVVTRELPREERRAWREAIAGHVHRAGQRVYTGETRGVVWAAVSNEGIDLRRW